MSSLRAYPAALWNGGDPQGDYSSGNLPFQVAPKCGNTDGPYRGHASWHGGRQCPLGEWVHQRGDLAYGLQ
jgi:hypothetical protein